MTLNLQQADYGKILEVHKIAEPHKEPHDNIAALREQIFAACLVAVYDSIEEAERALHILHNANFQKGQISLVMSRLREDPALLSEIEVGHEGVRESALCAGLGGVLGYLGAIVVALVTGIGTVFLIGPIAGLVGGATVGGCLGAIAGLGVHHEHISYYEHCVKGGKVLVVAHGNPSEVNAAGRALRESGAAQVHLHAREDSLAG